MPKKSKIEPKFPEQSTRVKTAMAWNNLGSTKALFKKLPASLEWKHGTTNNVVQGKRKLGTLERPVLAVALGIDPDYLLDGGPEPFPSQAAAEPKTGERSGQVEPWKVETGQSEKQSKSSTPATDDRPAKS